MNPIKPSFIGPKLTSTNATLSQMHKFNFQFSWAKYTVKTQQNIELNFDLIGAPISVLTTEY